MKCAQDCILMVRGAHGSFALALIPSVAGTTTLIWQPSLGWIQKACAESNTKQRMYLRTCRIDQRLCEKCYLHHLFISKFVCICHFRFVVSKCFCAVFSALSQRDIYIMYRDIPYEYLHKSKTHHWPERVRQNACPNTILYFFPRTTLWRTTF